MRHMQYMLNYDCTTTLQLTSLSIACVLSVHNCPWRLARCELSQFKRLVVRRLVADVSRCFFNVQRLVPDGSLSFFPTCNDRLRTFHGVFSMCNDWWRTARRPFFYVQRLVADV